MALNNIEDRKEKDVDLLICYAFYYSIDAIDAKMEVFREVEWTV